MICSPHTASFILYGALVIGGGKQTQAKVKRVFPNCEHVLFDVAEVVVFSLCVISFFPELPMSSSTDIN